MPIPSEVRDARPGDELTTASWNWVVNAVKQLMAGPKVVGGGLVNTGDSLNFVGQFCELATSVEGGIRARVGDELGEGMAVLWAANGKGKADGQTVPVYNPLLSEVPEDTTIILLKWKGLLVVIGWECPLGYY